MAPHIMATENQAQRRNVSRTSDTPVPLVIGVAAGCIMLVVAATLIVKMLRKRAHHARAMADIERREMAQERGHFIGHRRPSNSTNFSRPLIASPSDNWAFGCVIQEHTDPQQLAETQTDSTAQRVDLAARWKALRILNCQKSHSSNLTMPMTQAPTSSTAMVERNLTFLPNNSPTTPTLNTVNSNGKPTGQSQHVPATAVRLPRSASSQQRADTIKCHPNTVRSASLGALGTSRPAGTKLAQAENIHQLKRGRSLSFGAPPTRPPSAPVPPIPITNSNRSNGLRLSSSERFSSTSLGSTNSDILMASPSSKTHEWNNDSSASSSKISGYGTHTTAHSTPTNHRRFTSISTPWLRLLALKGTKTAQQLHEGHLEDSMWRRDSCCSGISHRSTGDRLSISRNGPTNPASMSRVSSSTSLGSCGSVKKIRSPTRKRNGLTRVHANQTKIAANGSPARYSIDPSSSCYAGYKNTRHHGSYSKSPASHTRTVARPSALKGSPYARKYDGQQRVVRISTLTPEAFDPPSSAPSTPGEVDTPKGENSSRVVEDVVDTVVENKCRSVFMPSPLRMCSSKILTPGFVPFQPSSYGAAQANCSLQTSEVGKHEPERRALHSPDSRKTKEHDSVTPSCTTTNVERVDSAFTSRQASSQLRNTSPDTLVPTTPTRKKDFARRRSGLHVQLTPTDQPDSPCSTYQRKDVSVPPPPTPEAHQASPPPIPFRSKNRPTHALPSLPSPSLSLSSCIPSPLEIPSAPAVRISLPSPSGPRCEPARSLLRNAVALRRMNSEVAVDCTREGRRYARLGREASPIIPWPGFELDEQDEHGEPSGYDECDKYDKYDEHDEHDAYDECVEYYEHDEYFECDEHDEHDEHNTHSEYDEDDERNEHDELLPSDAQRGGEEGMAALGAGCDERVGGADRDRDNGAHEDESVHAAAQSKHRPAQRALHPVPEAARAAFGLGVSLGSQTMHSPRSVAAFALSAPPRVFAL